MGGISIVKIHIVQKGDTLWKISKRYGVDFELLKNANQQLVNHDMIMPGMKINIPSSGITKKAKQTNKEYPVKKEMPVKEAPKMKKPKEEVKKAEVTKPLKPIAPLEVPTPPEPMPPPKAEPKPSYQTQQAKMNVNIYHQPSYQKVQPPPAPIMPAKKPEKMVKEKPKPKPKPMEMVKPKAVDKMSEKKMPVKKVMPPKPVKQVMPPKPKPKQMMHAPVYQQVGPVIEDCIPFSALCGFGYQQMYPNNMMYPQPQAAYQQPYNHHPNHSIMHNAQANMYHPEPFQHSQQLQHSNWQGYQRSNPAEEKENSSDFRNNSRQQGYGDVTTNDNHKREAYVDSPQTDHTSYYGMVPWNYPVGQFETEEDMPNRGEEK